MKTITTNEELYSFIKDLLKGAYYEREMQVFGFTCDCYGNGMSIDTYETYHTKDGISLAIQDKYRDDTVILAFWDTEHTLDDQCFGLQFEDVKENIYQLKQLLEKFCNKYDDPMWDINRLRELDKYIGDYEEYEPSPEELDAQIDSYNEFMKNPYADMYKGYIHEDDVTPAYCNIISAMACYMSGEFTKEQLIEDIKRSTDNNKDVIKHLNTIL